MPPPLAISDAVEAPSPSFPAAKSRVPAAKSDAHLMSPPLASDGGVEIRDVWASNLDAEFALIVAAADAFPFAAMDTEFPGAPIRPLGRFATVADNNYHTLRANVDLLHLIQLGLALSDAAGNAPVNEEGAKIVWQFNFREFDVENDISFPDSIELLENSGIDLGRHRREGVEAGRFGELLMSSGLVLNDGISWVTFHCAYDFAYLLKVLTGKKLPETREGFVELVRVFFPVLYDIKHLMRFCNGLHGGLSKVAEQLDVKRVGICHQAGSDSWVTDQVFSKLLSGHFGGEVEEYAGVMYGLDIETALMVPS